MQMEMCTQDFGKKEKDMVKESIITQMVMCMKENLLMIRSMVMEY